MKNIAGFFAFMLLATLAHADSVEGLWVRTKTTSSNQYWSGSAGSESNGLTRSYQGQLELTLMKLSHGNYEKTSVGDGFLLETYPYEMQDGASRLMIPIEGSNDKWPSNRLSASGDILTNQYTGGNFTETYSRISKEEFETLRNQQEQMKKK